MLQQVFVPVAVRVSVKPQALVRLWVKELPLHWALVDGDQVDAAPQHLTPDAGRVWVLFPGQAVRVCVKELPLHWLLAEGAQLVAVQGVTGGGGGVTGGGVTGGGGGAVFAEHDPEVFVPVVVRDERGGLPGGVPVQPEGNLKTRLACLKRVPEQRREWCGVQEPVDHEAHALGVGL